jgi:sigma-E factor negative regulatory protein RseA
MDGEGNELELHRVLASVDDPELRAAWARYHLARDALREVPSVPADISLAVRRALDDASAATARGRGGAWRALASFAVAASVTVVVVLGGRELAGVGDAAPAALSAPVGLVNSIGGAPVRASLGSGVQPALEPAAATAYRELARQRLDLYGQEHAEHAALNTPQGLLPFARLRELNP